MHFLPPAQIESKRVCLSTFFTSIRLLDDEAYIERASLNSLLHLGGIQIGFDAFRALGLPSSALPSLSDFSLNGLYFIAYGQVSLPLKTRNASRIGTNL